MIRVRWRPGNVGYESESALSISAAPNDSNGKAAASDRSFSVTKDDMEYFERRRRECIARAASTHDPHLMAIYRAFAVQYTRALQSYGAANDEDEAA